MVSKEEAVKRAREATEGVAEAMHWLRISAASSTSCRGSVPAGEHHARRYHRKPQPVLIVANKNDLPDASPARIRSAFPQHPVISISSLEGNNVNELYEKMTSYFG